MDNVHQQVLLELITQTKGNPNLKNNDGDLPLDIIELPLADVFDLSMYNEIIHNSFSN